MAWNLSAFADEAGPSCDEQIAALQQAGLNFIDIRGIDGHNCTTLPLEAARQIKPKLDAAGIKVAMWGSPLGKIDITEDMAIDLDKLRHLAALAPIFNCRAVRIFSYYNKTGKPKDEFQAESLKRLGQLKKLAGELGMVLYHENESHIFGDKGQDVLTIAKNLRDGPNGTFRMIFDFGNYCAGNENTWDNWLMLRDTTDAIHLKENMATPQGRAHVPVGQGEGQVQKILADAMARGWQGPLTVEPHLQHSKAVAVTGPSGVPNQSYASMTGNECFQAACQAAKAICKAVNAPLA